LISIIPKANITPTGIKHLRDFTAMSLGEIQTASRNSQSICDINIFGQFDGMSDTVRRQLLVRIATEMAATDVPYCVFEIYNNGEKEELNAETLRNRIAHWRRIELETQMLTDLERGHIDTRDDFVPHDEDWTQLEF